MSLSFLLRLTLAVANLSQPSPAEALSCRIASVSSARVIFVYSDEGQADEGLIRCLAASQLPVVTLTLNAPGGVEKIGNSSYSSMHILTLGGDVSRRLTQMKELLLDLQMKRKRLTKYLLVFRVPCESHLENFFAAFWASGVLDVVAVCTRGEVFTFEPFSDEGFRVVRVSPSMELFYDKLRNLHHFQLRISQFHNPTRSLPMKNSTVWRGVDGLLAMTVIDRLNATVKFVVPRSDELYGYDRNGTLTGALRDVTTGVTHVGFNARIIDPRYGDYLRPVGQLSFIYLVVPKATMVPQYLNFIRVFDSLTWWIFAANFVFVGVAFACMQRMVLKLPLPSTGFVKFGVRQIAEMLFKTAIGDPVDGFHRISSLREFLMAWILFCYVISSIYLAKMESVFVHPEYESDIDSLRELSRLKVPVYANPNLLNIMKPVMDPEAYEIIASKLQPLPDDYEHVVHRMVKTSQEYAFILRLDRANTLIARTYNNEIKRPAYHLVKEYLITLLNTYIVTRGSPFLEKFETLQTWCFEHGLLEYFETRELHRQKIRQETRSTEDTDEDEEVTDGFKRRKRAVVLDLNILQGAFYTWLIGMAVGCAVFVVELVVWHRRQSREHHFVL